MTNILKLIILLARCAREIARMEKSIFDMFETDFEIVSASEEVTKSILTKGRQEFFKDSILMRVEKNSRIFEGVV